MMTPKEVREHGFPQSRKGYDMAEVDEFLDALTEDYTALYNNYGKLSNSYSKLRKKAQALAAALEQSQSHAKTAAPAAAPAPVAPAPAPQTITVVDTAASQAAADELLRAARKDAEAIRAGAERERQEIIDKATDYAQSNAERLKAEAVQAEARLAALKKSTAEYISQVKRMINRQVAAMDELPVDEGVFSAMPVTMDEPDTEPETADAAGMADEITRNLVNLGFDDEDPAPVPELTQTQSSEDDTRVMPAVSKEETADDMDATGSLFDVITGAGDNLRFGDQYDEE